MIWLEHVISFLLKPTVVSVLYLIIHLKIGFNRKLLSLNNPLSMDNPAVQPHFVYI